MRAKFRICFFVIMLLSVPGLVLAAEESAVRSDLQELIGRASGRQPGPAGGRGPLADE